MRVAVWNILADGLSTNEFLTKNGSTDIEWTSRGPRIIAMIDSLTVDLIATIENDHPLWILNELNQRRNKWKAVVVFKSEQDRLKHSVCRKLRPLDPKLTFESHVSDELASLYDCQETDYYRCDNTMTVYYNSETYRTDVPSICFTPDDFYRIPMVELGTKMEFNLVVAHLKSGERLAEEALRVAEMIKIFTSISDNTIILMDSNNGPYYESEYKGGPTVSQTIHDHKFVILDNPTGQCFKLRHSRGDQPNKFGQLMFDTIDKIVVPNSTKGRIVDTNSILSVKERALATLLRLEYRSIIKDLCVKYWSDTVDSIDFKMLWDRLYLSEPYEMVDLIGLFEKLYPNEEMPSDHPPVVAEIYFE
jgi:hypothetical protein